MGQFWILFLFLLGFWIILSGSFDLKNVVIGVLVAFFIPWLCRSILDIPAKNNSRKKYAAFSLPYLKLVPYLLWLFKELVKANIDVALLVLNPKMPISPQIVNFREKTNNPIAQTILATSIILTPGTITIDVDDNVFTVHALTKEAASSLAPPQGEGEMSTRVAHLFGNKAEVKEGCISKSY
ncbi:MAG: Na+/H+ antiporter subunit E [Clostridia bacterium]|nr:Na+/H+ antiporter subunit E [Clostridia bacterium]